MKGTRGGDSGVPIHSLILMLDAAAISWAFLSIAYETISVGMGSY